MNLASVLGWLWDKASSVPPIEWIVQLVGLIWNWSAMQSIRGWGVWDGVAWLWDHSIGWAFSHTVGSDVVWSLGTVAWLPTIIGAAVCFFALVLYSTGSWVRGHQVGYTELGCTYQPDDKGVIADDPGLRVKRDEPIDRNKAITRSRTWRGVLLPLWLLGTLLIYMQWVRFSFDAYVSLVLNLWLCAPLATLLVIRGARRAYQRRYQLYLGSDDEIPPLTASYWGDVLGYYRTMFSPGASSKKTNADKQPIVAPTNVGYRLYLWYWRNLSFKGGVLWHSLRVNPFLLAYAIGAQLVVSWFAFVWLCFMPYRQMRRAELANDVHARRYDSRIGISSALLWRSYQLRTGPVLIKKQAVSDDGRQTGTLMVVRDAEGKAVTTAKSTESGFGFN